MKKCIYLILMFLMVLSCQNKKTHGEIVYLYPDDMATKDRVLYNPRWMNGTKFIHNGMKAYKLEEKDFVYIESCAKKGFRGEYNKLTKRKYFRQFIGYKKRNKIYVYINYFAHIKSIVEGLGAITPDIGNTIITGNGGDYAFGHMLLDYSSGEIVECEFKK